MTGFPDSEGRLDRKAIERAFRALSRKLGARGVRAHIYVVVGAALVMAHRRSRSTRDVDALTLDHREEVLESAADVAREHGLSLNWLNDGVRRAPLPAATPDARAPLIYDSPHLVVTGASAEHMLAMKVRAARLGDERDIEFLIRELGISTLLHVEAIHRAVYPHDPIPEQNMERVQDCLQRVRHERAFADAGWTRSSCDFGPIR